MPKTNPNQKLSSSLFFFAMLCLLVLPSLNNVHYDPQPQFWAEITVIWAIIGLFLLGVTSLKTISIPIITIPLTLFASYILLQPHLINIDYPGLNYITALEMLFCIMLSISINSFKSAYSLKYVVETICYTLAIGAILQSLIGFIQYTGTVHYFGDLIFYDSTHPTSNIFGHFGQRNHYAHYLSWGVFAIIYLFQSNKINIKFFYPLLCWFSFSLTIAASRSVFIYFFLAIIISFIFHLLYRNQESWRLFLIVLITAITLVAFEYFYPLIHKIFTTHNNFSTGLERISSENGTGRRTVEWQKAWLIFKDHPLIGIGWNEYAKEGVALHYLFPNAPLNDGLFTNCHNLILQLLAETGIIGALIFTLGIILAIYRLVKNQASLESICILFMIMTTLAHSMNEYPLWYLYFLSGLITFTSLDCSSIKINSKIILLTTIIPLGMLSYLVIANSLIFDRLVDYYDTPDNQINFNQNAKYLQNLIDHNIIWAYHASYSLDNYINVDSKFTNNLYPIPIQYYYTHKFASFHPYPDTLIKEAMLDWNLGNFTAAKQLVKIDTNVFPVYTKSFKNTLKAKKYQELNNLISDHH